MRSFKIVFSLLLLIASTPAFSNEGMWLPNLLKKLNEPEMKSLGMRISAEDIYSINNSSLKDAVVHFGGGCTGEIISSQGLLLTNHHCGYGQIQRHSSPENNYLEYGFWANDFSEELSNPGLTATFIVRIEDVSAQVLEGISNDLDGSDRQSAIDKRINEIKEGLDLKSFEDASIRPFFEGNEYYLFITKTYRDVRLVGTPPSFIGKYGADTDNWVWPRHTGDFAIFRIYADENNEPAAYDPNNKPYEAPYAMKLSMNGVQEDDFVFAFGFPGRTNQYLHSAAIDQVENVLNPVRVNIRERALAIIDAAMRSDANIKIQYANKQSRISNYWKKWMGESLGLKRSDAIAEREAYEKEFNRRIAVNPNWQKWTGLTNEFAALYKEQNPYAKAVEIYQETVTRNSEAPGLAMNMLSLAKILEENGAATFDQRKSRLTGMIPNIFKDYQIDIDKEVFAALMDYYDHHQDPSYRTELMDEHVRLHKGNWTSIAEDIFANTHLTTEAAMFNLMAMDSAGFLQALESDKLVQFIKSLSEMARESIYPKYNELTKSINALKRSYMEAQRIVFSEKTFYPDANSTLRVSYGKVSGYQARDAVFFEPLTTIDGVMEKYVPGDYEFDLDDQFRNLVKNRDFGKYEVNGSVPVNFIAAIHTTGGNSGSPVINGDGHLVGLLFDGAWEGVMSDIYYSEDLVRSIMVDIRYVLFIIDKYAGAQRLLDEMTIIEKADSLQPATKSVR